MRGILCLRAANPPGPADGSRSRSSYLAESTNRVVLDPDQRTPGPRTCLPRRQNDRSARAHTSPSIDGELAAPKRRVGARRRRRLPVRPPTPDGDKTAALALGLHDYGMTAERQGTYSSAR